LRYGHSLSANRERHHWNGQSSGHRYGQSSQQSQMALLPLMSLQVSGARYISMFPLLHKAVSSPLFSHERGKNLLDGGAPFYTVYQCKDGQWMSVGCLEPQFFQCFLSLFQKEVQDNSGTKEGSWKPTAGCQTDRALWPDLRRYLEDGFKAYGREHWEKVFHGLSR